MPTFSCLECQRKFHVPPSAAKRNHMNYCSNRCKNGTVAARFWGKVQCSPSGCWLWTGMRDPDGYGHVKIDGHTHMATHVAWFFAYGEWPKHCALHHCDNPPCVRPFHLFDGTKSENGHDRHRKGRTAGGESHGSRQHPDRVRRGAEHGMAKLTDAQVLEIRRRYAAGGVRQVDLAHEFGVSQTMIGFIVRGESWTHL